ncbi:MAG: S8 family peptidase [Chitinophagales bacterium]|nr:S8 family peptidase [Chitinophagales bacterium]
MATLQLTAQVVDSNFRDGVLYVKVKDTSNVDLRTQRSNDAALNLMYGQFAMDTIERPFDSLNVVLNHTYRIRFNNHAMVNTLITAMEALPYVEFCEKEPLVKTFDVQYTPNDLDSRQYGLLKIFAPDAWNVSQGDPNIVVAIVDNGVRTTHEDLAANIWINPIPNSGLFDDYPNDIRGWDVADNDNNPSPPTFPNGSFFSHGTHCAGIAGAVTDNSTGIASIGFNISIMPVKCAPDNSADSGRTLTNAYDGVYYAMMAGAHVISMSWGGDEAGFVTGQNLINAAYAKGIVLVAAAGNENVSTPFYPAAFDHVLSVGATDGLDIKASYSNYGNSIDVMAPGNSIYSTIANSDNAYGNSSGTSMACPLVAGLAALVLSQNSGWGPDQVMNQIKNTADNIDLLNTGLAGQLGTGRINAAKALGTQPTAINEPTANDLMQVYPNPSDGRFTIKWLAKEPLLKYQIFDLAGKVIMEAATDLSHGISIQVTQQLAQGTYVLKLSTLSGQYNKLLSIKY